MRVALINKEKIFSQVEKQVWPIKSHFSLFLIMRLRTFDFNTGDTKSNDIFSCGFTSIVDCQRASYGSMQCIAFMTVHNPFELKVSLKDMLQNACISLYEFQHAYDWIFYSGPPVAVSSHQTTTNQRMQFLTTFCHTSVTSPNFVVDCYTPVSHYL